MKLNDWKQEYYSIVHWIIRRCDSTDFYNDKKEDWLESLFLLNKFESELFDKYLPDKATKFNMRYQDWFNICHKYIDKARKESKRIFAEIIFTIWTDINHHFKTYYDTINPSNYIKDATDEEVEQAEKDFNLISETFYNELREHRHTFNNKKVLEYRGNRFIIDNEWGDAWVKDETGKIHNFQLIWDWWYPIDRYLDLNKGWEDLNDE